MKTRWILAVSLCLVALWMARLSFSASASPAPQVVQYATPTPLPDGRIIYIVQEGDTCLRIQLMTGISVEYIRSTNRLDENCTIVAGQKLIIGVGGPAAVSPTAGPSPTPTSILPTPTPFFGLAEVCVLLYADLNGDALRQETEPGIPDGAVSLTSATGIFSQTLTTVLITDPTIYPGVCFKDVPEGDYTLSAAIPDGYNPTTVLSYALTVTAGDQTKVSFGAQAKSQPATPVENGDSHSPVLGIIGAVFLLGGIGLGVVAWQMKR